MNSDKIKVLKRRGHLMSLHRISNLSRLLLILLFCQFGRNALCAEKTDREQALAEARQAWKAIQTADVKDLKRKADDVEGRDEYWSEIYELVHAQFLEMVEDEEHLRVKIEYFVDQFGRHGPRADMRWILAEPRATLSLIYGGAEYGLYEYETEADRKFRRLQMLIAEFQVRQFLNDPERLHRYYHASLWYRNIYDYAYPVKPDITAIEKHLLSGGDEQFWWHARAFVLLAHATGRDDLLKTDDPYQLLDRSRDWDDWLEENGPYLRPQQKLLGWRVDEREKKQKLGYIPFVKRMRFRQLSKFPDHPFPDWQSPPVPPGKLIEDIEAVLKTDTSSE